MPGAAAARPTARRANLRRSDPHLGFCGPLEKTKARTFPVGLLLSYPFYFLLFTPSYLLYFPLLLPSPLFREVEPIAFPPVTHFPSLLSPFPQLRPQTPQQHRPPQTPPPRPHIYKRLYRGVKSVHVGLKSPSGGRRRQVRDRGRGACARSLAGASRKRRDERAKGSHCLLPLRLSPNSFIFTSFSKRNSQAGPFPVGFPPALDGPHSPFPRGCCENGTRGAAASPRPYIQYLPVHGDRSGGTFAPNRGICRASHVPGGEEEGGLRPVIILPAG